MGKITKPMQVKHRDTLSPWLKNYVESASTTPLPLLPKQLAAFPSRWPFGRGDLYHWVPLLNRFDSLLEQICKLYNLGEGPQDREFECDLLLSPHDGAGASSDARQWDLDQLAQLGFPADGDRALIVDVLKFTRMLLEHCGNRSIYASSAHLNDLLNTASLPVLMATLEVGSELAQRYQASVKRIGNASRQISSALLANHYNIDLDRVQQITLPFAKTPIVNLADSASVSTAASTKGKEKVAGGLVKNAAPLHAHDLIAVAASDNAQWNGWGDVKVTYFPQETAQDPIVPNDLGRSSLPSTPTPLRRSSTAGAQQQTPRHRMTSGEDSSPVAPRTPGIADDHAASGSKTFELPQSALVAMPVHELVNRCPSDMSPASKYETFHRMRVAKALVGSSESRQQLLATRLLAITNLAYIHTESNFVDKALRHDIDETRRYQLVYQLAELIHPSSESKMDVPLWLQSIGLALLEAVSGFHTRCPDVVSALNANVNHGVLLYVIRKAVAGMKSDDDADKDDQATEADQWRNNLFSLTLHLSMATRVGSEMVSAGLMDILVEMLNIRSKIAQRHHSMVLAFLDGLIWTYQVAFTAFFSANGLDAVAQLVIDTVKEAQSLRKSGKATTVDLQSGAVDYEIAYYQQQTLKWLLKFVHHVMSNSYSYSGNTDRLLRNLADKSDLLGALRDIMDDKKAFGSVVWTNSVTILSDFINNDPTSFAAISESGMIKTYLEAVTGRPILEDPVEQNKQPEGEDDDPDAAENSDASSIGDQDERSHPPSEDVLRQSERTNLAAGILPSPDAINVVPQVLNSICLKNAGMRLVITSRAFDSFFEIFESPAHVKCLEADSDLANNVGGSFDELARHHPALRTSISNAVIDMVARVRFLGLQKAQDEGWGAKLSLIDSNGNPVSVGENTKFEASNGPSQTNPNGLVSSDVDVDMSDVVTSQIIDPEKRNGSRRESPLESITPYFQAVAGFLHSYVSNPLLKTSFIEQGGLELILDICESPSLPASFGDSVASRILNQVVSLLIEHSPVRGLPSLLCRAQAAVDILEPLAKKTEVLPPHFAPFLSLDLSLSSSDSDASEVALTGTKTVKGLLNAQTFIKIVSECFPPSRSNSLQFYTINVYDKYLTLVKSIGPLLRGVLAEEAGELTVVPQHWSLRRAPSPDNTSRGAQTGAETEDASLPDIMNNAGGLHQGDSAQDASPIRPTDEEQTTPRFQNYETLRTLLHPMIPTTFPLFQSLGKALLPRRETLHGDLYPRPRHLEIAKALADTVLGHLGPSVASPDPTSKDFHYWIIMLHTIHEMLIDHPTTRQTIDRSNIHIIMPVLLAFKEQNGLEILNSMLRVFAEAIRQGNNNASDESSKSKVAAFGLKKVLDLYFILVHGKYIADTSNHFNLQRQTDKSQTIPNIYQQIVVEFRAVILPALTELWGSSFVERVPDQTIKRLLDILKVISLADSEPPSTPKDKSPFLLLKYTDTRFDWRAVRGVVSDLLNAGYDEDLVHEAVFRANGQVEQARDYCRAHKAGLAGPRNPIPSEDADVSALAEASGPRPDREPSNGTNASDVDRMSLDTPAELSRDSLEDLIDHSPRLFNEPGEDGAVTNGRQLDSTLPSSSKTGESSGESLTESQFPATKEELDNQRAELREDLIDRCLDVIRAHPDCAVEVAELITALVLRHRKQDVQEEVCSTLTLAMSSLASDDEERKRNGKCIAAYAHLLALLLQDEKFFERNIDTLRDTVNEHLVFLKLPPPNASEELPPWLPFILLIWENFLAHDERPVAARWKAPKSLDEAVAAPVVQMRTPLIDEDQRIIIVDSLLDLLPRVGKDEVLATSTLRALVILTRARRLAKIVGDKKSLQRLFLMAKQLSGSGSERMKQTKLTSHIMTILRHIVEDEDTTKQVMRAEILVDFQNLQRNQRIHPDIAAYLRSTSAIALRAPDLFVEVTNELLRFSSWTAPNTQGAGPPTLVLKDQANETVGGKTLAMDTPAPEQVKPSTELVDKEMSDAPKPQQDSKRPMVENPDGVVHFLLCELVNYREVDDKEASAPAKDTKHDSESISGEIPPRDDSVTEEKDKKGAKPTFKAEDHPIFIYRCFLLNCLTELLQSYNRAKVEFINFKRSAPPLPSNTPVKPRSSVLNYLISDLLCRVSLAGTTDSIVSKKNAATSAHTQKVLVALIAKTKERPIDRTRQNFEYDDEPDLLFVRKFVLDTILKAYEKAPLTDESLETRYSRMQCLAELINHMVGERDKDQGSSTRGSDSTQMRSQAQMRRLMYEKGYMDKLTASIAEINLNFPGVKRAIKYILRALRVLTDTAKELSHSNILPSDSLTENTEEDVGSTSSLSDLEDDREETPDLYRNSTLGMLEPHDEDDESEGDDDDDDEDMYGDEYDDEEMDYGDEELSDGEEDISEDDEVLGEMGEIEGLHGEPGVVEVIMDEDDDDEDDSEEDDDDDDVDSADMEDIEDRVEIVDEEGNPIEDDDGHSSWESDSDAEDGDDPEEDDIDYDGELQDDGEARLHGMVPNELLDNMARAIMGDDGDYDQEMPDGLDGGYLDEDDDEDDLDEEEEDLEDEFVYDDYHPDEEPPPMPALGWDNLSPDADERHRQLFLLDNNNHNSRRRVLARMDNRSPLPPGFMVGSNRDPLGDFRSYFSRNHRSSGPPPNADDGTNPLLRRNDAAPENLQRHGNHQSIGLRLPEGLLGAGGRHHIDGPMGILGELMEFLPIMGRNGQQAFHLQITGQGATREAREVNAMRGSRTDHRRDASAQEPQQAVAFTTESTLERYQAEARMVFGPNSVVEASKLNNAIAGNLTPGAIDLEKKLKAEEAEKLQRLEEEQQKREAEERLAKEAKEAEEKASREKQEAEERAAAEQIAAESEVAEAAELTPGTTEDNTAQAVPELGIESGETGAMEGVEATEAGQSTGSEAQAGTAPAGAEPRVMTLIQGEEVDVTELGIDPDYLAALPEEFRTEVIAQTVSTRRSQAREEAATGESTEVFQEFLDALPEELRLEIVQQERQEQRRRNREDHRRQAIPTGVEDAIAADMDPASILLTFPPALREQVLMDQGQELMDQLPPEMAAQARALSQQHNVHSVVAGRSPSGIGRVAARVAQSEQKAQRRKVVQMLDKAGVATLLRLMFIAQPASIRSYLFSVFADVCENRQNRLEVISTVLQILQEGSIDMDAVDRSFGQLSLKARKQKEKDPDQRTPQSLKRSLTTLSAATTTQTNSETSPLLILQQCLDLLVDLCTRNPHVPWLFLTEHETVGSTLKRTLKGKDKAKDLKAYKYAINSLLTLLDREMVTETLFIMALLADLLNRVTLPLQNLERRRKEAEKVNASEANSEANPADAPAQEAAASEQTTSLATTQLAEAQSTNNDAAEAGPVKDPKDASGKRPRQIQPPFIPPQNLTLVVRIFVAPECNSKTFQNTISTIKNLSAIPGAKAVFGEELVRQARDLCKHIVSDLDDLLPYIEQATSGTEIQGVALSKFSPGASEQNKLLRVLTALDHLFDVKKKGNEDDDEGFRENEKQDLVTSLYHNPTFSAMWEKLSACLKAIYERENMINIATILLPLIESLMVVCKNTTATDDLAQSQADLVLSSPQPESRTANLFFTFTEEHRRILNELVRNNPKLMSGTFSLLVKNPKVLEFDNKRNYFSRSVHSRSGTHHSRPSYPPLQLAVRREHVFHDSFKWLSFKSADEMKFGKLNIRFHGEEGVDAGGVTREWFQVLARQMFDPNYALFIPVSSDRTTFHPNKLSGINDEHLMFFKFIGRIIGKALYEGRVLDCYFSRAVYKRILGKSVSVKDMESFDPDYYKSLCWMLENDITDIITETFSVEDDEFGVTKVVDLIPNGREVAVTDHNKHEYVRLVVEHKLLSSVKEQMENFLKGFRDIIPSELIAIFDEQELELLISGLPDIDLDDWKSNSEYHNYSPSSPQIQWFWRAVRSFDKEERAKLLQFVTGTSKVPLNGFKELEGMNGINRFNIHRDYSDKDRLPTSHTCFNQLDLPEYDSYEALRSQIMKAITAGSEGFGFA